MIVILLHCMIHPILPAVQASSVREIKIGVLIRHRGPLEEPLNRTLEMLNADASVLPNARLTAIVERIESDNSYHASAAICRLLSQQVWTIIGPQSIQLTPAIQSMTSNYRIPLVLINWQPVSYHLTDNITSPVATRQAYAGQQDDSTMDGGVNPLLNYTVNLFPMADQLSRAYLDMIRHKEWKTFTLIYDSSLSFLLVKDILEASFWDTTINIQRINLPLEYPADQGDRKSETGGGRVDRRPESELVGRMDYCNNFDSANINLSYKKLMKDLRKRGVENLVLSMSLDKVCKVLVEASKVGLLTVYNDYVIANLDAHLLNLTRLQPLMTNLSGYSILLNPEGQQTGLAGTGKGLAKELLSTEFAMMSDAISLVAHSLDELISNDSPEANSISSPRAQCSGGAANTDAEPGDAWQYGAQLMDVLKRSVRRGGGGYTGDLKFDKFGQRVDFRLVYVSHKNNTFERAGSWSPTEGLRADRSSSSSSSLEFGLRAIKGETLKVTVARTSPYVMYKANYAELTGNDRYEGYCIDLLDKLAKKLQFHYVIREVADGQYGKIQNGSWTGMVRELLDWRADLAIVDLTITKERQAAVDFTHPFMTLGIAIMYKRPKALDEPQLYSFLVPLSKEVWLSMGSAYVGISLTLWMISRLSPLEWKSAHPCFDNQDERDLENEIHSIGASLWFTLGSLMQQGSDLAPRSPSVRALASVWYFFTLILISSYTANFAAFLTASRMHSPIENAEDLSKQTRIDYGCKEGGSTQAFFAASNHSTHRRMWNFMELRKHQGVFPEDNSKGINMVKRGNFAFLMESTSIEYMVQRDCDLTQIGGLLDHKGYGIALRKRSPFRAPLSKSIVELNEAGELSDLKNRWWSTNSDGTRCDRAEDSELAATFELGIDKVGGVFVLLGAGVAVACCTAIGEFIWSSLKTPTDQRGAVRAMLWREMMRLVSCGPSKRPAAAAESLHRMSTTHLPSETNLNRP